MSCMMKMLLNKYDNDMLVCLDNDYDNDNDNNMLVCLDVDLWVTLWGRDLNIG